MVDGIVGGSPVRTGHTPLASLCLLAPPFAGRKGLFVFMG